jgi:hypothetical protein
MSNPLTFLRPLRYDRVRSALVVQTGRGAQMAAIVRRLREIFPGATVEVLLREADGARRAEIGADHAQIARFEERMALVGRLRRRRFDVIVLQLDDAGGGAELRLLPFLLRTRSLIAFNDRLDYFELNVFRLSAIAHHFEMSEGGSLGATLAWLARRALVEVVATPLSALYVIGAAGWIHLRGRIRAARRGRAATAGAD